MHILFFDSFKPVAAMNHRGVFLIRLMGFLTIFTSFMPNLRAVSLPRLFCDRMVMQRDTRVPVWGWGDPGESVKVQVAGKTVQTTADSRGEWKVMLEPMSAGGPYELVISGRNVITVKDVLFGEVWLCSGQSNMQWTVGEFGIRPDSLRDNLPELRLFNVFVDTDYLPRKDVKGGGWTAASPASVTGFSATAYFFGRELYEHFKVPVGLITSCLGATSIETWMSAGALRPFPAYTELVDQMTLPGKNYEQLNAELTVYRQTWDTAWYFKNDPGIKGNWQDPSTDISDWKEMQIPALWEDAGLPDYDGSVWFRKEFDLPAGFSSEDFNIALNQIDDYDIAWVNGVRIGESFGGRNWRNYFFKANILRPKGNILVVRVFDTGGKGGMYTNAFWGNPVLTGTWKYKPGVRIDSANFPKPVVPNGSFFTHPTLLYNANIAPLQPYAIRGAIWYQGESNVAHAQEYESLLPAMITDWRRGWSQGDFPFLVVQLANYYPEQTVPNESEWAELRSAQMQALSLPNTAVASAIDLGDANDIHPKRKQEVGARLALAARKIAYGEELVHAGPVFRRAKRSGVRMIITFDQKDLVSRDKFGFVRGFTVAGADGIFHWAVAYVENGKVVAFSPAVKKPLYVRYAWADNPGEISLYNTQGLPAYPFRTDSRPLSTQGKTYIYEENGF